MTARRSLTLLSGNLLSGGSGRSRTETRFEPSLRIAAELQARAFWSVAELICLLGQCREAVSRRVTAAFDI